MVGKARSSWFRHQVEQLSVALGFDLETPWRQLPEETRRVLMYGSDGEHEFVWEGRKGAYRYRDRFEEVSILSSMGEVGNCYDNALAERMNGILKLEYGLDNVFIDFQHAHLAVREAVWLYNFERPHLSLEYQIPVKMHTA